MASSILYLATDKGVITVKSEDSRVWKIEHQSLEDWDVPKIAVSPARPNVVFAGTRGDGVWVSEDFGKSWHQLDGKISAISRDFPEAIAFDPSDSNRVYAALRGGELYSSDDGGDKWAKLEVKVGSVSDMKCVSA